MITKDNIVEMLKHNGIEEWNTNNSNGWIKHTGLCNYLRFKYLDIDLDNPNLITIIEAHIGKKLEPLPESKPFDAVKVGQWVKMKAPYLAGRTTQGKWYQRVERNNGLIGFKYVDDDNDAYTSNHPEQWDLTDIRDYNPDEEIVLKVGDKIDLIDYTTDTNKGHVITKIDYFNMEIYLYNRHENCCVYLRFDSSHKIESVNGRQGKYIIPPFDFEQTLLDAGFKKHGKYICLGSFSDTPLWFDTQYSEINDSVRIKLTPANAKRLIDTAFILNNLELAE